MIISRFFTISWCFLHCLFAWCLPGGSLLQFFWVALRSANSRRLPCFICHVVPWATGKEFCQCPASGRCAETTGRERLGDQDQQTFHEALRGRLPSSAAILQNGCGATCPPHPAWCYWRHLATEAARYASGAGLLPWNRRIRHSFSESLETAGRPLGRCSFSRGAIGSKWFVPQMDALIPKRMTCIKWYQNITILIGGMVTIPSHGWFMTLFYPQLGISQKTSSPNLRALLQLKVARWPRDGRMMQPLPSSWLGTSPTTVPRRKRWCC